MIRFLVISITLLLLIIPANPAEILAADKAAALAQDNKIFLVDIRSPAEWKQSGVAKSAYAISMHQKGFLNKLNSMTGDKKDAAIALICATGGRSTWIAGELEKRGFTNVINVREGMMGSQDGPGWLKRGLPLKQ